MRNVKLREVFEPTGETGVGITDVVKVAQIEYLPEDVHRNTKLREEKRKPSATPTRVHKCENLIQEDSSVVLKKRASYFGDPKVVSESKKNATSRRNSLIVVPTLCSCRVHVETFSLTNNPWTLCSFENHQVYCKKADWNKWVVFENPDKDGPQILKRSDRWYLQGPEKEIWVLLETCTWTFRESYGDTLGA